ncbi:hypothetical protein [Prochlorococcus sp. MIT 1223]|uniref:hypothetical protein n=1 Tax=Prochlorococcus sp. MIT 1223 TaxID=3096217 RepID=UPI002A75EAE4|nr:hypothetical protein [Prochlorococcus sp. MIT 1223]
MRQLLGKFPGKTIHIFGVAIGGFWLTGVVLNFFPLEPKQSINRDVQEDISVLYDNN